MSKTLSTEMSVDQLRRHIAERSPQVPTERMEIEEAEIMLQAKLLEQSNQRLDQLTAGLDQLRAELAQMQQSLHETTEAQRGLQRAIRRYARSHTIATLLLLAATAVLLRVGWAQMEQSDLAFLSKTPPPSIARPTEPATPPQSPAARSTFGSPYHLIQSPAVASPAKEPIPAGPPMPRPEAAAALAQPAPAGKPSPVEPAAKAQPMAGLVIQNEPRISAVIGPAVLGPAPKPAEPAVVLGPAPKAVEGPVVLGPQLPAPPTAGFGKPFVELAPTPATVPTAPAAPAQAIAPSQPPLPVAGTAEPSPGHYISIWGSKN